MYVDRTAIADRCFEIAIRCAIRGEVAYTNYCDIDSSLMPTRPNEGGVPRTRVSANLRPT